jgi:hypothetical protein
VFSRVACWPCLQLEVSEHVRRYKGWCVFDIDDTLVHPHPSGYYSLVPEGLQLFHTCKEAGRRIALITARVRPLLRNGIPFDNKVNTVQTLHNMGINGWNKLVLQKFPSHNVSTYKRKEREGLSKRVVLSVGDKWGDLMEHPPDFSFLSPQQTYVGRHASRPWELLIKLPG